MAENFLERWARRKSEAAAAEDGQNTDRAARPAEGERDADTPSMQDASLLTPDCDFSRFVARSVNPDVRRAALKTLFSDPHFQQMDGLDIYIGDYTRPSPLAPEMVAALWHAKSTLAPRPLYPLSEEQATEAEPEAAADTTREAEPAAREAEPPTVPEPSATDESCNMQEPPASREGTRLPFNENVIFSRGSD